MKALSLWQPWASLWVRGRKIHETRHWSLTVPVGGVWLAVHAAKRLETNVGPELEAICVDEFGPDWRDTLPRGAIIGRVHITRSRPTREFFAIQDFEETDDFACGNYTPGRYAFETDDRRELTFPIPWRGMQSLFSVPDWPEDQEVPL